MKAAGLAGALAAGAMSVMAAPAQAHHSAAMFDETKVTVINGTVKAWQFVNPHSWLQVVAEGPDGKRVQWAFEGGRPGGGGDSPNANLRRDTFKPGDKVSVKTHPMKDGRPAGSLGEVTFADGHKWAPRAPAPPPAAAAPTPPPA